MTRTSTVPSFPGPLVHNKPTLVSVLSSREISTSELVPGIVRTVNAAFLKSHIAHAHLGMTTHDRIGSAEEFVASTAHDPEAFIIVIHSQDGDKVYGTATARRYLGPPRVPPPAKNSPWVRRSEIEHGFEEWELKLTATHPEAQGQGLAGFMMRLVDDEVIRRFKEKQATTTSNAQSHAERLKMTLCTPTEVTADFYLNRGYKMDYESDSYKDCKYHIAFMSREIIL